MKRIKIIDVLKATNFGTEILIMGWVRTKRISKNVCFIALNDGSTINNLQIVVDVDEEMYEIPAVIKAPVTFKKSVLGKVDADQLAGYLVAANIASASMLSAELITLIEECVSINAPKADADGYIKGVNLDGIGQNYIKPMIK